MFEKISRIVLDILLDFVNQIKLHFHEFEIFDTDNYRRSDLHEVLKEEHLRVVFYEKVKNSSHHSINGNLFAIVIYKL